MHAFSSFDRQGGNDDRNTWLRRDGNGEYVLFERLGAGCVYRFWCTYSLASFATNRVRVYFDGEATPRIDLTVRQLFSGDVVPFVRPLVGNKDDSSGGCYCYLPLPFRRACRITMSDFPPESERSRPWSDNWGYYQVTWHAYDAAGDIRTWDGTEDTAPLVSQWTHAGETNPNHVAIVARTSATSAIPAGATQVLYSATGTGSVVSIVIRMPDSSATLWNESRLRMYWDGLLAPAVDVPLGPFFGTWAGPTTVTALLFGMDGTGRGYCHFPMPYWAGARIELTAPATQAIAFVAYEVACASNALPAARAGRFHALYRQQHIAGPTNDYAFLATNGCGHLVSVALCMRTHAAVGAGSGMIFLENDERLFVDGSASPSMHGTGTEDYFNCGWYFFTVPLSRPLHGYPAGCLVFGASNNWMQAYRIHLGDTLPYRSRIRFGMEAAPYLVSDEDWSSVACFYALPGVTGRLRRTAVVAAGDPASEALAGYTVKGSAEWVTNTWSYPASEVGALPLTATGRVVRGGVVFQAALCPSNAGVVLRRRIDRGPGMQGVNVMADGLPVGAWFTPDCSWTQTTARWQDETFDIPAALTGGKSVLHIELQSMDGAADAWTDYGWNVDSIMPLDSPDDVDRDGLPDAWEAAHWNRLDVASGSGDDDGDGLDNAAEWLAQTDPRDADSVVRVLGCGASGQGVRYYAVTGRWYRLQVATNLLAADPWASQGERTPSSNGFVDWPVATPAPVGFYRLSSGP